jgi:hypothetical protein
LIHKLLYISDPIDDITEQPFSNQNDFEGDSLVAVPEEIERSVSPFLTPDGKNMFTAVIN